MSGAEFLLVWTLSACITFTATVWWRDLAHRAEKAAMTRQHQRELAEVAHPTVTSKVTPEGWLEIPQTRTGPQ